MRLLARASAGLLLWAFGFSLLYALHGLGCARGWSQVPLAGASLFFWSLLATWILITAAAAANILWVWARLAGFERKLAIISAFAGLVAIVVTGSPIVLVASCL